MDFPSIAGQSERPYISTGHLPEPERFKSNGDGDNSQVYPALARVPRDLSKRHPPATHLLLKSERHA